MSDAEARTVIMDAVEKSAAGLTYTSHNKGYDIVSVDTVSEAVESIRHDRFKVYLTDRNIPDGDALKNSNEVHRTNPDMAVIIMTAIAHRDRSESH